MILVLSVLNMKEQRATRKLCVSISISIRDPANDVSRQRISSKASILTISTKDHALVVFVSGWNPYTWDAVSYVA